MNVFERIKLTGQTALVTGAAGRLGREFCRSLAELECGLILLDRNVEALEQLTNTLAQEFSVPVLPVSVDLENEAELRDVVTSILAEYAKINILVNSAAFVGTSDLEGWVEPFEKQSISTWRRAMEVNLAAPFLLSQLLAPALKASTNGRIINIGSIYGIVAPDFRIYQGLEKMGNPAAYASSKGGLYQLTLWLATALAPQIRVNGIVPGGVKATQDEKFIERYSEKTPLGRMADPDDISGALVYLATDLSKYVTGQNIVVDGGWSIW